MWLSRLLRTAKGVIEEWSGCIGGALTPAEFERGLTEANLAEIEIRETHRVHEHAGSAIIRALPQE
jgi:arsenite methyltransferase